MNWFTKSYVGTVSDTEKKKLVEEWGGCEHVVKDHSKVVVVNYENDIFGKEGYCICAECNEKQIQEKEEQPHCCNDCNAVVKAKDGRRWTWYDFYPAQGDVALFICNECLKKEKHIKRVQKDLQDYEEEMDSYNKRYY